MKTLPQMPEWLVVALNRNQPRPQASLNCAHINSPATAYGSKAREHELQDLRLATQGSRNHQLNRSAFALAQLVAGEEIEENGTRAALVEAAISIGLPQDEVELTIASGWQAGLKEPRSANSAPTETLASCRPFTISADLLAKKQFPELKWAIPGILPEGLAILAGRPKFGKSYLSLQFALSIALGDGLKYGLPEMDAGDVLVCAMEDSQRRLRDRLKQFHPFGNSPPRLHFATDWPRIGQGGIEELDAWCDLHPNARLIVIDTWRAIKQPAGRGSAYDEDANAAAPLLDFARRRPGLAVLVIHHVRKSDAEDVFDMISGTNGLTGIFDTLMVLARYGEGAKLAAQGRDLESYEKALERDRRTGGWIFKGEALPLAKTGERQELLDVLAGAKGPMRLFELADAIGKKPDTTRHLLKALLDEGTVQQPCHGQYALTPTQFTQHAQFGHETTY